MKLVVFHNGNSVLKKSVSGWKIAEWKIDTQNLQVKSADIQFPDCEGAIIDLTRDNLPGIEKIIKGLPGTTSCILVIDKESEKELAELNIIEPGNYLTNDLSTGQMRLVIQMLLKQKAAPTIAETHYKLLFELSPTGLFLADDNGTILDVNSTTCKSLGYNREELLGLNFRQLVPKEMIPVVDKNIANLPQKGMRYAETVNLAKDGSRRVMEIKETSIPLPDGKTGILVASTDITDKIRINKRISESEEKYRLVVENANDGIVIVQDTMIVFANEQCKNMIGYEVADILGKSIFEFLNPDNKESVIDSFVAWRKSGRPISVFETELVKINGELLQVEMNSKVIQYQDKDSILVMIRDISERIKIHNALRESEVSYRSIFDHAGDAIYIQDELGVFLDVNPAATRMYGYTRQEMVGYTPDKLTAPGRNDLKKTIEHLREAFKGIPQRFEFWGKRKNGELFPKDVVLNKGRYFGKDVVFAMARDISERYEVLEALRESEGKYRSHTQQLPVGVYRTTTEGNLIYSNPALAKMLGFESPEELLKINVKDLYINAKDRESQYNFKGRNSEIIQSEFQLKKKSGEKIWVRDNSRLIFNKKGQPDYFDGVLEDITSQKLSEKAMLESEMKLRATLQANPDLMFRFDRKGNFLDYHANASHELYVEPSVIIGSNIYDHFSGEIAQKTIESINNCLNTGELQTMEYSLKIHDETKYYEARHVPVDKDEVLSFSRDVTERRKREEEIRMMARALMSVNDCVTITDENNILLYVNEKFCEVYGYKPNEVIGKSIMFLRTGKPVKPVDEIMAATIEGGWKGELINKRKDGSTFPIQLSTSVVRDENNNVLVLIGVSNDITDQKKAEEELMRAKEKAEESDRLKSAFLANMSHEIRSPMNGILGFAHLLKEENLSITARQYIEMIQTSGNHLLAVINDIVDISKIQANQLKITYSEVNLNDLMDELYLTFSSQLKTMENMLIAIHKIVPEEKDALRLKTDMVRLRQVFINLLSNSLKFTASGHIAFGYQVKEDHTIEFFVKDTGIGIPYEFQPVLFERFRQADESLARGHGGAGLGLAISKGIIDLLGGRIWFESVPDRGTAFYFTLPLNS